MLGTQLRPLLVGIIPVLTLSAPAALDTATGQDAAVARPQEAEEEKALPVQYLEIVTPEVEATCKALAKMHGVEFGKPVMEFGNARTAKLRGGGLIGVRAPMREDEDPVVRPYVLVEDIDAAVEEAKAAGAEIAIPPMAIPERGKFSIFIHGGIQHGLWQL